MAFEPSTRVETLILLRTNGRAKGQQPRYRRARFSFVEYDGIPERYVEPNSASLVADLTGAVAATDRYRGIIDRVELFDETPPLIELHDFSDTGL